jgi:hypothetical protein
MAQYKVLTSCSKEDGYILSHSTVVYIHAWVCMYTYPSYVHTYMGTLHFQRFNQFLSFARKKEISSFQTFTIKKFHCETSLPFDAKVFVIPLYFLSAKGKHSNLKTERRISCKTRMISLVKQGKFKVGVVPADRLRCLLLTCFVIIEGCSLAAVNDFWANLIGRFLFQKVDLSFLRVQMM